MPRNLEQLKADGDTVETLRDALASLDDLVPTSEKWVRDIATTRAEITAEIALLDDQGSLF